MMIGSVAGTNQNQNTIHMNQKKTETQEAKSVKGVQTTDKGSSGEVTETKSGVAVEITEALKEMYEQQAESAKKAAEGMEDMAKLMEIARRIAKGDHVPPSDEKKLAEYDSDLYQIAKAAAVLHAKEKHKKHDALFDDEEEGTTTEENMRELKREAASDGSSAGSEEAVSGVEE